MKECLHELHSETSAETVLVAIAAKIWHRCSVHTQNGAISYWLHKNFELINSDVNILIEVMLLRGTECTQ